ncbi:MAG: YicC family protein [Pseudomonadales bacterium]|nr:YicC family protein [Pseudomonadales bacterium]
MLLSMTSFARHEHMEDWGTLIWELKSVNHRYLEPTFKLPDFARACEHLLRDKLRKNLSRGKIECTLRFEKNPQQGDDIRINEPLLNSLIQANNHIAARLGQVNPEFASTFLQWPGILESNDIDKPVMQAALITSFATALSQLIENRQREGAQLKIMIEERLSSISDITTLVHGILPQIIENQRNKLINRFHDLKLDIDNDRLEQEIVLLAQKIDVDEELDRLQAHLKEVANTLSKGSPCGRRLDFLMQELNREANTLGSKSISIDTTQASVDLKVYTEQMREQIQNIE